MERKSRRIRILSLCFLGLIAICYIANNIAKNYPAITADWNKTVTLSDRMPGTDSAIFKHEYLDKLKVDKIATVEGIEPISMYIFDGRFNISVNKIEVADNKTLKSLVNYSTKSAEETVGVVYSTLQFGNIKYAFDMRHKTRASRIYLTLAGDSLKTICTDLFVEYNLLCKNVSFSSDKKEAIDVFFVGHDRYFGMTESFPLDVLLFIHDQKLYLLAMTPTKGEISMPPGALRRIVSGLPMP